MGWYVFALVDDAPRGRIGNGLTGPLTVRRIGNAFAVVERRADVPPADFGSLERHQRIVSRLAARVPAILPVRFGTLLDTETLDELLAERDEEIAEAFDAVRGRVQFTWRRAGAAARTRREPDGTPRETVAGSGATYLRRAAAASRPVPPPPWRTVRAKTAALVAAERYQPGSASVPDTLYHLLDRGNARGYATIAAGLVRANPALTITGPWPPFAFAPEVL